MANLKKPDHKARRHPVSWPRKQVAAQREIDSTLRGLWQRYPAERGFLVDKVHELDGRRWVVAAPKGQAETP